MFKYLAVIHDSFREAMASRVLWLVLLLITLLLLSVAPLGYREELTWHLGENDVREWPDFMVMVREVADDEEPSPTRQIWLLLDEKLQDRLRQVRIPGKDEDAANPFEFLSVFGDFRKGVNQILEEGGLYDSDGFRKVPMTSAELRDLRDEGVEQLEGPQLARFNRLLLEAAFPELIRSSPPTSIQLTYAWTDFGSAYPLRGETLRESLQTSAVWAMNWFVGVFGVFVAVLVTAPIIPQMFDTGALHLLLSKPISRSLLFLSKYIGGCMFILIGAAYLIGGIWLILGVRFGVWEPKLLLSIPIYLFVFAIYYAVAALTGVVSRSAIVSIALTILFWLACFLIGTAKVTFEATVWNKSRLTQVLEAGESLLAVNEMGTVHEWSSSDRKWNEIFVSPDQRQARAVLFFVPMVPQELRPVGPVYDPTGDRVVSIQPSFPPGKVHFYAGQRETGWDAVDRVPAPRGTVGLFRESDGSILAVSSMGLYRLREDAMNRQESMEFFGMQIPLSFGGPFVKVSPDPPVLLTRPATAAMDSLTHKLAVYSRGTITLLTKGDDNNYERVTELDLDGEEREPVVLAIAGERLLVGREDGRLQSYDTEQLSLLDELQPEGRNPPRFITAAADGSRFACIFHNGNLWLYDGTTNSVEQPGVSGQGDISTAMFLDNGELLVADQNTRLTHYALPDLERTDRNSPRLDLLGRAYRYGLLPLYTVFPKPGELDKTIQYLLSGRETEPMESDNLQTAQQEIDPWTPVWSSGIFTIVMLLMACVYIEWQDF